MLSYSSLSKQHSGMPSTVWDTRRKELAKYKQQNNGSTNVPRPFSSNIPLGNWVKTQRYQYKLLQEEKNSSMTTERIKSLNELDFEWNLNSTPWEEHLQELTIYKQANESTNVPRLFPSNIPLGQWVGTQRTQYRLFNLNEKSSMTTERIKSLNELDFEWSPGKETSALWEQRLQELTIYKQKNNGSTNVPQHRPATKLLGQWVQRQRYQYRLFNLNEKSPMTTERIKSLNELDFEWSPGNKKESKRSKKRK